MVFVYIRLGEVLLRRNKYEEARKFAKQGLTQFKNDAELLSIVGMSYMPSNLGKASKYCQKSIKINPNLFKPYINLGDIEKAQENYEKAEEMYRSALTKANISQKGFTQLMLSLLHFQTGDLSKAISFFKKSFKTNPNLEEIMLNKGFDLLLKNTIFQKALDQMQVENYFECQETLRPLYRKNKESIPIIFFLGICHFHLQNMSKSRHFLRKVLKLSETSAKNEVNDLFILRSEDLISTHFTETPEPAPVDISDKPSESLDQVEEAEEELITQEGNYPNFQENLKESEAIDEEIKEIKVESSPPKLIPRTIKSNSLRQFAKSADPEPEKNCSIF
jgi:tetratricopeptide (TPR) repeat protein